MDGESPYLIDAEDELNESPNSESVRETRAGSSSGTVAAFSNLSFLLGSGGRFLLLVAFASSRVGDPLFEGVGVERLECLLEFIGTAGGSPFITPGHGTATDTSLQWKCSCDLVVTRPCFPEL